MVEIRGDLRNLTRLKNLLVPLLDVDSNRDAFVVVQKEIKEISPNNGFCFSY